MQIRLSAITILTLLLTYTYSCSAKNSETVAVTLPAAQLTELYLPMLEGKRVGVMANHTTLVDGVHLVDTLLASGVDVAMVFAPEHGFRGTEDAGAWVSSYVDDKTGVEVVSAYGRQKKPAVERVRELDVVVFDIQDVGLRYYTYLSSMHYMMESCAEADIPMIVLDRPNPNGMYVDGPVLDPKHRSFVGMHPIPVVHGMTLGELALMINDEGWLEGGARCKLAVVLCRNYTHATRYQLPVRPSPNLPNMRSIYLYPSLCFMEGTPVSIGRGTDFPFQVYGHPDMSGYPFSFTPQSVAGATNPPQKGKLCYGVDLRCGSSDKELISRGVDLSYTIDAYNALGIGEKFFTPTFELLTGVDYVRQMIMDGYCAEEIRQMWSADVADFKLKRKSYLLYDEE